MTKKELRRKIFEKYDGCCAYCGCDITLENFQIDHIKPLRRDDTLHENGLDTEDNMMPVCRSCNLRKGVLSIETFRSQLSKDVERLKRDVPKFNLLLRFGLVHLRERPVVFYFEKEKP